MAERRTAPAAPPRRRPPRKTGTWRRLLRALLLAVSALLLAAGGAAWWLWRELQRPHPGFVAERELTVRSGSSVSTILADLESAEVIADARLARLWLRLQGDPPLQAGDYALQPPLSTPQVLAKLIRGEVAAHRVTVVEGLTLEESADRLASSGLGELDPLLAAMRDPEAIADLDPAATDLEGYLFPDSYSFHRGVDERTVVAAMVANFRRRWRADVESLLPAGGGRSVRELVTLASIVEKEARLDEERPLIAAVYANRLEQRMGLYADPTIIFALKRLGRWNGNLRRADLALDSPYNTYRNAGLPPGPICSPGAGSLVAAAQPADVPYLYFVSRNDGSHVFATTLAEHNRNVTTWQRRYWRQRRNR